MMVWCNALLMKVAYILLGRSWKYDKKAMHNGRSNTYTCKKDGEKHIFFPLKNDKEPEEDQSKVMLLSGK